MQTEYFESVKNQAAIKKCLGYSDHPEELKKLLNEIDVKIKFTGIHKHFLTDERPRLCGIFEISRNGRKSEFDFGFSIKDTEIFKFQNAGKNAKAEFMEGLLYDCLACCSLDYYTPIDFDDFCSEFGYDNDSQTAEITWKACLKQSSKLQKIFTEKEIEYLPR